MLTVREPWKADQVVFNIGGNRLRLVVRFDDAVLSAIDGLMGTAPDTPEGDELEVLVPLVEAYEATRWPVQENPAAQKEPTPWRSCGKERLCTPSRARVTEVIRCRGPWPHLEAVEFATLEWVDWFNTRRLLEPIGHGPPAEYEEESYRMQDAPAMMAGVNERALRKPRYDSVQFLSRNLTATASVQSREPVNVLWLEKSGSRACSG